MKFREMWLKAWSRIPIAGALFFVLLCSITGGVRVGEAVAFGAVLLGCFTMPGAWLWRRVWSREDCAGDSWMAVAVFGTVLGMLVQLPVYLMGVVLGFPRLPVVSAAAIALWWIHERRAKRGNVRLSRYGPRPHNAVLSWTVGLSLAYSMVWISRIGWVWWPYPVSDPAMPNGDEPYQVALISELRHHVPPTIPTVAGEPLEYHWFVNAHLASVTWITGASPVVTLDRLWLPCTMVLLFALVALVARNVTSSNLVGALSVAILAFVGDWSPFLGVENGISAFDEDFLSLWEPLSPSLGFGLIVMLLAIEIVRRLADSSAGSRAPWWLFGFTAIALGGSKATALPMLVCGGILAGILSPRASAERRVFVQVTCGCVVGLIFSHVVLFRGASQGMWIEPLHISQYVVTKFGLESGVTATAIATGVLVCSWAAAWAGVVGLARVPACRRPVAIFLFGTALSGVCATLILGHPHYSEDYFVRFAAPLFAILSAWGLALFFSKQSGQQAGVRCALAVGVGLSGALLVQRVVAEDRPVYGVKGRWTLEEIAPPTVALGTLVVLFVVVARFRVGTTAAVGMGLAAIVSAGLCRVPAVAVAAAKPLHAPVVSPQRAALGPGALATADWLREHTSPDDLFATNGHTRTPTDPDNRHAWIAGYAERRVLVEGWAYTPEVFARAAEQKIPSHKIGFWDPELLHSNDAAFKDGSGVAARRLHDERGVDYLVADLRYPHSPKALEAAGMVVHREGAYVVIDLG